MLKPSLFPALAALSLTLFACTPDEPDTLDPPVPPRNITKSDALTTANANLRAHLIGGARSGETLASSDILGSLFSSGRKAEAPCPPDTVCEPPVERTLEDDATDLASEIAARVLHESNVESEESTKITLRLKPEVLCRVSTSSSSDLPVGPTCMSAYAAVPVRLELSSFRAGDVDVRIIVGNGGPIGTLALHESSIAIDIDLAAAFAAFNEISRAEGHADRVLQGSYVGRVRLELKKNAELDYALIAGVTSQIRVDLVYEGESIKVEIAAANPAVNVHLDGSAQRLVINLSTGAIMFELPLAIISGDTSCPPSSPGSPPCEEEPRAEGSIAFHIPSENGTIELSTGDLLHTAITMGDALRVKHQNVDVLKLDVNPATGRRVEADVTFGDGNVDVILAQSFLAEATFDLASLANTIDVPSWLQSDTLTARLDGAPRPGLRFKSSSDSSNRPEPGPGDPPLPTEGSSAMLEVLAGQLRLSSRAAAREVTVTAGQCLVSMETESEGHPFDSLSGGSCE